MPLRVAARADAHEGDPVAVARVHVRLDLEDEPGERAPRAGSTSRAVVARGSGAGRVLDECRQQLGHAEIVDRRAEEDRRLAAGAGTRRSENACDAPRTSSISSRKACARGRRGTRSPPALARPSIVSLRAGAALLGGLVGVDAVLEQVVDAAKLAAHADRPGDRRAGDPQHASRSRRAARAARAPRGRAC